MSDEAQAPNVNGTNSRSSSPKRRVYTYPKLFVYGNIRTFTMGGSPGVGDSGAEQTQKPPKVP